MSGKNDPPAGAELIRDWAEIWASELAALAQDRETTELMARLLAIWSGALARFLPPVAAGGSAEPHTLAGAAPTPGPAPAAAAPGGGESVTERIARLEARIAELERAAGRKDGGTGRRPRPRKPGGRSGRPARGTPAT